MILPVYSDGVRKEFCVVELQGEVEHGKGLKEGFTAGTFSLHPFDADTVYLQVGYHRLEGKRIALKKPMAILRRISLHNAAEQGDMAQQTNPEFTVAGYIKYKYLFKNRPKALISNSGQ